MRVVAQLLGLVGEVVRIDADAVPADEPRAEWQEVPLGAGSNQDLFGVDVHALENHREFVHERDIDVALRVLDDLGRLGHLDARGLVRPCRDDRPIEFVDKIGYFRRRA